MMKVLYVTNLPAPYKIAFLNLLSKNIDLTVIYERKKALNRNEKWKSETENLFKEIYLVGKEIGNDSSFDLEIIKYLNKYDYVIMNGYSTITEIIAITYMRIMHIPYIIACDGALPTKEVRIKFLLKKWLICKAKIVLSSGTLTTQVMKKYIKDDNTIFEYPFSSISDSEVVDGYYDKTTYKKMIGCKKEKMILYVGQPIHRKGIDILEKAFNEIDGDEIALYLVGGEEDRIEGERKHVVSFKTKEELSVYYRAADLFVLPTREDIWGLVVNEAMAYGVPVITTDKCGAGIAMVRNEYNGWIVRTEDEEELRRAIINCLQGDGRQLCKNSIDTARKYTIEKMAESIYSALKFFERNTR